MDKITGMKPKSIKKPPYDTSKMGFIINSADVTAEEYPVFCLKYLLRDFSLSQCNRDQKAHFVSKLAKMAQQTWDDLEHSNHWTGAGFEMIPKEQVKGKLPKIITDDVDKLLVMRFKDDYRMIGHRSENVYHITHIEIDKSAYNHGK